MFFSNPPNLSIFNIDFILFPKLTRDKAKPEGLFFFAFMSPQNTSIYDKRWGIFFRQLIITEKKEGRKSCDKQTRG